MESYKHSCPLCGQRIEYTADYCGQQMQCPSCGKTVTFPAIPPGRGRGKPAVRVKELEARRVKANAAPGHMSKALGFLRDYEHWNVVWQCTVPFLIIGLLLAGAAFVKKKFKEAPDPASAMTPVQADPQAWQKMADLTKADQAVQALLRECVSEHAAILSEQRMLEALGTKETSQRKNTEQQIQLAQNIFSATRRRLDTALQKYQQLGGTVDYRNQIPY